jgi:uncharacterized protein (TIGR00369 family)
MSNEVFVDFLNKLSQNTLMQTLDIKYTEADIEEGWLKASMPVTSVHHQPFGMLHGGATISLAESLGSAASNMFLDPQPQYCVGLEMSANHIKSVKDGMVYGKASVIHKGKRTHLWEIRIEDEKGSLISLCKLTNMVINKK